jgi:hypothetical protein
LIRTVCIVVFTKLQKEKKGIKVRRESHSKKKVFYQTKKGSSPCHTGRSFFAFAKRRFRMKLLLGNWGKWFRTRGLVRNLYRKNSKRFRTHSFVPNLLGSCPKRFRTDGFVQNLSRHIQLTRKLFHLRCLFRIEPLCIR